MNKTMQVDTLQLPLRSITDVRGVLTFVESEQDIPFSIRRVYWLDNLSSQQPRGFHAHHKLRQAMFCLRGSCEFILDDGFSRETVKLDSPSHGLLIDQMVWHEMCFSDDCLLLMLASDYYDESDYLRDYASFLLTVRNKCDA